MGDSLRGKVFGNTCKDQCGALIVNLAVSVGTGRESLISTIQS